MSIVTVFSKKILKIKNIHHFFPEYQLVAKRDKKKAQAVAGWGQRPTTLKARLYAAKKQLPFIALEDGFLRSLGLGAAGHPPLSLIADEQGIYYDARSPSQLEWLIKQKESLQQQAETAQQAMSLIVQAKLSKYNHAPDFTDSAQLITGQRILIIDQTQGDMAVESGGANQQTFSKMLIQAKQDNPGATLYIKTHPDVINGYKQGYLAGAVDDPDTVWLRNDCNPLSLIEQMDKIYTVTSQMGFEALLLGKPVITFGLPWYAGWGMTDDRHPDIAQLRQSKRRTQATLLELFTAAYLLYCRYINPNNGQPGTLFDVIDYLTRLKKINQQLRGPLAIVGCSFWKKQILVPYLQVPSTQFHFYTPRQYRQQLIKQAEQHPTSMPQKWLIWGQGKAAITPLITANPAPPIRMEDGFIRSVGLGSNFVMPYSLVLDSQGIYFNSQTESELESLLQHKVFSPQERDKAEVLQQLLIQTKLAKYNVGDMQKIAPDDYTSKLILIPGQVEDDASIRYGSPVIKTNLELIKRVRADNPTAFIIYKPHPDVLSGNRAGNVPFEQLKDYVDRVIEQVNIIDCIEQVEEVHTLTSLAGFEALIRHKQVVCYGQPFYAGWGLTDDKYPITRRNRCLSISELIYGVMYDYAIYLHPKTLTYTDPQTLVHYLYQKRQYSPAVVKQPYLVKQWSKLKQIIKVINKN